MELVITESRRKAARMQQLLGPGYRVVACSGRIRDLPDDELGVQLQPPTFEPRYVIPDGKHGLVAHLGRLARSAEAVFLATDPDREGEALAWHLAQVLELRNPQRIRYRELTAKALKAAISRPSSIDTRLVDAQQARRILDRLVGYQISPLLRAFGRNHSAGRVQSATLHLIAMREWERRMFQSVPYWIPTVRYDNGLIQVSQRGARGHVLCFDGFLRYLSDDADPTWLSVAPPSVAQGQILTHGGIHVHAKRTEPPPRFTEATLVAEMERLGLGHPHGHRATTETLIAREYISVQGHSSVIVPTARELFIDEAVQDAFSDLVEPAYIAQIEACLVDVAVGTRPWGQVIRAWHEKFSRHLEGTDEFFALMATARPDVVQARSPACRPDGLSSDMPSRS